MHYKSISGEVTECLCSKVYWFETNYVSRDVQAEKHRFTELAALVLIWLSLPAMQVLQTQVLQKLILHYKHCMFYRYLCWVGSIRWRSWVGHYDRRVLL